VKGLVILSPEKKGKIQIHLKDTVKFVFNNWMSRGEIFYIANTRLHENRSPGVVTERKKGNENTKLPSETQESQENTKLSDVQHTCVTFLLKWVH